MFYRISSIFDLMRDIVEGLMTTSGTGQESCLASQDRIPRRNDVAFPEAGQPPLPLPSVALRNGYQFSMRRSDTGSME